MQLTAGLFIVAMFAVALYGMVGFWLDEALANVDWWLDAPTPPVDQFAITDKMPVIRWHDIDEAA